MDDDVSINRVDATHLDNVMLRELEPEVLDLDVDDWEDDDDVPIRAFRARDSTGPSSTSPSSWQQGPISVEDMSKSAEERLKQSKLVEERLKRFRDR